MFLNTSILKIAFVTLLALCIPLSHADEVCHPEVDLKQAQYFIGYGSLMKGAEKRQYGDSTGFNMPVYVKDFQREWSARGPNVGITLAATFLGVSVKKDAKMAAAIFRIFDAKDVSALDEHEFFYCRYAVDRKQIQMADGTPVPDAQFWVYVTRPEYHKPPAAEYPITQFYADLFLEGCIELEKKFNLDGFLQECIETTAFWSEHWLNDRQYPRAAPAVNINTLTIDKTLQKVIPDYFKQRKIE
ncbi:gamma-glutamylcyclotransferase family protein [Candidatus Albibeggiatoa sp. nov. NOAA]|uniref:gamma-glutamylcyclotransferase family protein n=1 Tax=Candidatus Albibeggiatoa sp. nov. NOAA TaxID=3162724 RepID=UPI0032FEA066|nr:gamma-glutamylcyclotransferase [Thiotrichaceae bacterium]